MESLEKVIAKLKRKRDLRWQNVSQLENPNIGIGQVDAIETSWFTTTTDNFKSYYLERKRRLYFKISNKSKGGPDFNKDDIDKGVYLLRVRDPGYILSSPDAVETIEYLGHRGESRRMLVEFFDYLTEEDLKLHSKIKQQTLLH